MATTRYGIKDNQVRAFNKLIRVSHQKLNLVCDTVRGLPVARAIDVLKFSKRLQMRNITKTCLRTVCSSKKFGVARH